MLLLLKKKASIPYFVPVPVAVKGKERGSGRNEPPENKWIKK